VLPTASGRPALESQPSRPAVEDLQGFSPLGRIDMESLQLKQYAHRLTKILISRLQQPALLYPCRLSEKGASQTFEMRKH
jgi:hypothetical protein